MNVEQKQDDRSERIRLLATENRRRRERTLLSVEVGRITGQPIGEDEIQVAVGLGEADHSFANVGDGEEFERSFPEAYLESNRQLLAGFGKVVSEHNVLLYVRLREVWRLPLASEVAFDHVLEFANLENAHNRMSGGSFRVTSSDAKCGFDLSSHRYFSFMNNGWACYKKTWELGVFGGPWCEIAKQTFGFEPEA